MSTNIESDHNPNSQKKQKKIELLEEQIKFLGKDLLTTVVGKPQQKKCQRLNRLSRDLFLCPP